MSCRHPNPFNKARVTLLETPYKHSLHAYQGLSPWNPNGTSLLYAGFEEVGQQAEIVVRDLATGNNRIIGTSQKYDYHTAAYQQWCMDGTKIVYDDIRNGCKGAVVTDVAKGGGSAHFYEGLHVRCVSTNGRHGYGDFADNAKSSAKENSECVAMRIDFVKGEIEELFTPGEASEHLIPEMVDLECPWEVHHLVANADESMAFFKLVRPRTGRKRDSQVAIWGGFFTLDLRERNFIAHGHRISGHPQWMPSGRQIINIMQPLDGSDNRWLVLQDAVTADVERLIDFPIEGPAHPVVSPNGKYLALDAYTANGQVCPFYVIELATGRCMEIARFDHYTRLGETYQPHTITRANLHPVWSPDSKSLLINVNNRGTRLQMYLLEDFIT